MTIDLVELHIYTINKTRYLMGWVDKTIAYIS